MSKYKFIKNPSEKNEFDNTTVEISLESDALIDLIEAFADFLVACGFHPDLIKQELGQDDEL